jgi:hypothetical protein
VEDLEVEAGTTRCHERQDAHGNIHIDLRQRNNGRGMDLFKTDLPIHKSLERHVDIPPKEHKVVLRGRLQDIIGPLNLEPIDLDLGEGDIDLHSVDGCVLGEVLSDVVVYDLVDDDGAQGVGQGAIYDVDGQAGLDLWDCAVAEEE